MVDLFFILFNFAILVGLIYYGIRRYLLPGLRINIEQDRAHEKSLHDEHRALLLSQKQLEESTVTQEAECSTFLAKINHWRNAVDGQNAQREAEEHYLRQEAEKRLQRQNAFHMLKSMHTRVTPYVIKILERDLKEHFADENAAKGYTQKVLRELKK